MTNLEKIELEYTNLYSPTKLVLGYGKKDSDIILVGEAPGENEEKEGKPFVGKAGKNLDEFLEVVGIVREKVYITNVVKIRPTKSSPKTGNLVNRPPTQKEIDSFLPLLNLEIQCIKPKLIVTLGNVPLKTILQNKKATIGNFHGQLVTTSNMNVFPLYHPASIIYNQSLKDVYIEDLKKIQSYLHTK